MDNGSWQPADFYVSEVASALIRKKLREMYQFLNLLYMHGRVYVSANPDGVPGNSIGLGESTDELEAIAEAAYLVAMKAKEKA